MTLLGRHMTRLAKLRNVRGAHVEAFACLVVGRLLLLAPFNWFAHRLGKAVGGEVAFDATCNPQQAKLALSVRRSLLAVAGRLPWHSSCLVRAIAARMMLNHRSLPSALHLGVRYDSDGKMGAHAWLHCLDIEIVGTEEAEQFNPVAAFVAD